jgi:hypothetical protein
MGTEHPFLLQNASYRYGWMVACQARRDTNRNARLDVSVGHHGETFGDKLTPYLMVGPGPGEGIDAYLSKSPSGRFVAFRQAGKAWVYDASRRTRVNLSPFTGDLPDASNAAISFSRGHQLALVRRNGEENEVLVVDLETQLSRVVYATKFLITSVQYNVQGDALSLTELSTDTNGDGTLEAPKVRTNLATGDCRGGVKSYSVFSLSGDHPVEKKLPIEHSEQLDPIETLETMSDCLMNGSHVIASAAAGTWLVSTMAQGSVSTVHFGPVRWQSATKSPARPYCSHVRDIPKCPAWHEQQSGSLCVAAMHNFGAPIWGQPPEWYWVGATEYAGSSQQNTPHQFQREHAGYYYSYGNTKANVWLLGDGKVAHWDGQQLVEKRGSHYTGVVDVLAVNSRATWALGDNGSLYRWTAEGSIESTLPAPDKLTGFSATDEAQVYATTYDGITYRWNDQQWQNEGEITGDVITGLWGDGNQLWGISAEGELRTLRGKKWEFVARLVRRERRYFETLQDIRGTGPKDIWIASSANRLLHWDGQSVHTYDGQGWETFGDIVSVSANAVWVNSSSELIRLKREP